MVVVGAQWGDEGKGKITDFYAGDADVVVRHQGGNNAGHTIVFDGKKFALQSIPSGVFNPHIINVMANGMVINPASLEEELDRLHKSGITDYKLFISDRAACVMPYHAMLDGAYEALKGGRQIGTTKKGIGPAYTDKYSRVGIRMGDLLNKEYFAERLKDALAQKNIELQALGMEPCDFETIYNQYLAYGEKFRSMICDTSVLLNKEYFAERLKDALTQKNIELQALGMEPCDFDTIYNQYLAYGEKFRSMICDTSVLLNRLVEEGKKVLFEGAQGVMLCIDHGTYPFVTSSSPTAASVPVNTGLAPRYVNNVMGVAKAYTTRVGEGPFPTELFDERADYIRERGHEYGTVTGRPRRVGWLDTVILNHVRRISGVNYLSLMLFDVLSGLEKIRICTGYKLNGEAIDYVPSTIADLEKVEAEYIEMDGWSEDITGIKTYDELPANAKAYIAKLEELTRTEVAVVSVGPDREQTIIRKNIF